MKHQVVRHWTMPAFTLGIAFAIAAGGMTLARQAGKSQVTVTPLSQRNIIEKLDGKDARTTVEVVTIPPGTTDTPHRHTGPVFGYVLEGEYAHAIDNEPITTYKAGDTFYEPSGSVHRVAQNPSARTTTRLLAVIVHARDAKHVTVREKGNQ